MNNRDYVGLVKLVKHRLWVCFHVSGSMTISRTYALELKSLRKSRVDIPSFCVA